MQIRIDGKVAVVTGGDSGLGRGICIAFAEAGAKVVVNYHSDAVQAEEVVRAIRVGGGEACSVQCDVANEGDVENLFAIAKQVYGGVDILVANSGMQKDSTVSEMTLDNWRAVLDTNLTGQFLCARAAVRMFRAQGSRGSGRALGSILCMSSVHEVIPWGGHANYAASKGGVGMFMRTLAQEVAGEHIRVNSIAPGAIRTPINADQMTGDDEKRLLSLIPYGRIGAPEDVARLALFLVSDEADYIVGATVSIDGGMTLYPSFKDNG